MPNRLKKIKALILRKDSCVQIDFFLLLDGPEHAYHEILNKRQAVYRKSSFPGHAE